MQQIPSKKHNMFTEKDDEKLKKLIEKHYKDRMDKINWNVIAKKMRTKNKRQCKDRWLFYLKGGINFEKFSTMENYLLLTKVSEIGHRWRKIAKFFNGRTEISLKAQYRKLMRYHINLNNVFMVDSDLRPVNQQTKSVVPQSEPQSSDISIFEEFENFLSNGVEMDFDMSFE